MDIFQGGGPGGADFGSEMWVPTPHMGRVLVSFKHGVARRITGRYPRIWDEGGW